MFIVCIWRRNRGWIALNPMHGHIFNHDGRAGDAEIGGVAFGGRSLPGEGRLGKVRLEFGHAR